MGRGSSKAGGSAGGGGGTQLQNQVQPQTQPVGDTTLNINGDIIDLSASPLVYGSNDPSLTGNARAVTEAFENKRYQNKVEYSQFIDANGNILETNKGGKGSVSASMWARQTADVMSHNHPRQDGIIGGTFSDGDIRNFGMFNQTTYRATAKEGTYSITKGTNYHGRSMLNAYRAEVNRLTSNARSAGAQLKSDYRNGTVTYKDAVKRSNQINNAMLVGMHNWLLANQSTYNYTYTLERRK